MRSLADTFTFFSGVTCLVACVHRPVVSHFFSRVVKYLSVKSSLQSVEYSTPALVSEPLRFNIPTKPGQVPDQLAAELGFPVDLRDYGVGAQIWRDLGVKKMRLMTNDPKKIVGLEGYGMEVVERVPIEIPPNEENVDYLMCKKEKMGHLLHI